jgi:putative flippase GtrA
MFHTIPRLREIRLIYGILGGYGFGSEKFDNFTTDITRVTLAVVMGFQLILSATWSLALQTNIVTNTNWTFKPESGGEFKNDFTNFLINKNNILTLSLLSNLGK